MNGVFRAVSDRRSPQSINRRAALGAWQRMSIKKQEFYEGAALHLLVRAAGIQRIQYDAPFFVLNDAVFVLLKYSTKSRSPWGFTFGEDEQRILSRQAVRSKTMIGLICGSDGVAACAYDAYTAIAAPRKSAVHIACYRPHGHHYEISGPDGTLSGKVAPSEWLKILD